MAVMEVLGIIVFIFILVLGFALLLLGLAGEFSVPLGLFIYDMMVSEVKISLSFYLTLIVACLVLEALDFLSVLYIKERYKTSGWTVLGIIAGAMVGASLGSVIPVVGNIIGIFLGMFVGAMLVEFLVRKDLKNAWSVAKGTIFIKLSILFLKVIVFFLLIFFSFRQI